MVKTYRYYSIKKPPVVGTIPRGMINIVCFDEKKFVPEIGCEACGYSEYDHKLLPHDLHEYSLVPEPELE